MIRLPRTRRCREHGCHHLCVYPMHYCEQHKDKEQAYLQSRMKWSHAHDNKHKQHVYNTVTRNRNDTKSIQYQFYKSKQWHDLRLLVLKHDNYLCQYCLAVGKVTPAKTVDHIVPIEWQLTTMDTVSNLATICSSCHHLKTDWEQSYYGTGDGHQLKNVKAITDVKEIAWQMHRNR